MNKNYYCVIMAGGIGSRFWPLSRTNRPKQFLDILGVGKSLLQQTFERYESIIPVENFYVVTSELYKGLVMEQLPNILEEKILLEPLRRNTAPCIAYANYKIALENPNAVILVAPADHLILNQPEFLRVIQKSLNFAENNEVLLTLGIKPSRAETGYGYIQASMEESDEIRKVRMFTEKPNQEMAEIFYRSGDFFWNSGAFIWSLKEINKAFEKYLPEIDSLFKEKNDFFNTNKEIEAIGDIYSRCINISIDYGLMEKADNVHVLCSDFGWSDLGTWSAMYEFSELDERKNVLRGNNIFTYNVNNSIINVPETKLVVAQDLDGYIVAESNGILLICKRNDEQQIRHFVNDVKIAKGDDFV